MANVKAVMEAVMQSHKSKQEVAKMEKKPRVRMMTSKPYEGLKPGTDEWISCWKKNKDLQDEMLKYQKTYKANHKDKEVPVKKPVESTRKRIKAETEFDKHKREEAERQRKIDEYIAKNGVETKRKRVGRGEAAEDLREDVSSDITYEEIQTMSRKQLLSFMEDNDYDTDVGDTKTEILKEALCEELDLYPNMDEAEEEYEEEQKKVKAVRKKIQSKEAPVKKQVKQAVPIKKEVKTHKREVMEVATRAFGADGQTFDNYAEPIPANVKTIAQLKAYLIETGRHVLEFKRGEIRAYDNERVTSSGRVAKVTVKKQGSRMIPTYRSNKNSRLA